MRVIDSKQRRNRIGLRHLLVTGSRVDDPAAVSESVVALHSSDPATVFLSAAVRMRDPSIGATSKSLYHERSLVRHHAMRRTLWVMTPAIASLAHASSTRLLSGAQARRLAKLIEDNGVASDGAEWIEAAKSDLSAAIRETGPVTTRDLGELFPELAVSLTYGTASISAHSRVLLLLGFDGTIVRTRPTGSWISSQYEWCAMSEWIPGGIEEIDTVVAATALLDLYLQTFGPATSVDAQWWTGWTKTATDKAMKALGAREVSVGGRPAWLSPKDRGDEGDVPPWVTFLPGLDPTTMGWKERDWYLDEEFVPLLFDRNGNAGPTVWVDGRIVGGWAQHASGEIKYRLLDQAAHRRSGEIAAVADVVAGIYGETRHKVRFPSPLYRELLSGR